MISKRTNKLRKTLVVLVVVALILLPNLIAFADETGGDPQGTPTPVPTVEASPSAEASASPTAEASPTEEASAEAPTPTPTPVPSEEASAETATPTPEPPAANGLDSDNMEASTVKLYVKNVTGDKEYTITYKDRHDHTQTETKSPGQYVQVKKNTTATIKAFAANDYSFKNWKTPSASDGVNPVTVNVKWRDYTAEAVFEEIVVAPPPPSGVVLTFNNADGLDHYTYSYQVYQGPFVSGNANGGTTITVPYESWWYPYFYTVTVNAVADGTHTHLGWTIPNEPTNSGSVGVDMNANKSVQALFEEDIEYYTLSFSGTDCYYTVNGGSTQYVSGNSIPNIPEGTVYAVEAHATGLNEFDGWDIKPSGATGTNPITFAMNDDETVAADIDAIPEGKLRFYPVTGLTSYSYSWTYNSHSGSGTINSFLDNFGHGLCHQLTAPIGATVNVTANIGSGHEWGGQWTLHPNGHPTSDSDNVTSFSMPNDSAIQADLDEVVKYTLTFEGTKCYYTVGGSSTQYTNGDTLRIVQGASVEVTAHPDSGYAYMGWNQTPGTDANPTAFTMNSNHTVNAAIERTHYTLDLNFGNYIDYYTVNIDSVSTNYSSAADILVPIGADVIVTANPDSGYVFDSWDSNCTPDISGRNGNLWPFTMNSDHWLKAYGDWLNNPNEKFKIVHENFIGDSGSGSIKVKYNNVVYGPYAAGQETPEITYVDGVDTVQVQAIPSTSPATGFVRWANHGNITTIVMNIDLTTQQGSSSSENSIECNLHITIKVRPEFERLGSLTITKVDEDDNSRKLNGAVFSLTGTNVQYYQEKTTAGSGTAKWEGLKAGTYSLKEETPPNGYKPNTNTWTVKIGVNGGVTLESVTPYKWDVTKTIENEADHCSLEVEKVDSYGAPITGFAVTFTLSKDGGGYSDTQTFTDSYTWTDLESGAYTLTEDSAPSGYYWNTQTHNVSLSPSNENWPEFGETVTNYKYVTIHAVKHDITNPNGSGLEGAIFAIFDTLNGQPTTQIGATQTTNGSGVATFGPSYMLKSGVTYWIKELSAPPGYQNDPATATGYAVVIDEHGGDNEGSAVRFENTPTPGDFSFIKRDSMDESIVLEGAVYHLTGMRWNGSAFVLTTYELTTDSNGYAAVTGLSPGMYTFQEITPPPHYDIDPTIYDIEIESGSSVEEVYFVENDKLARLVLAKYQSGTDGQVRVHNAKFSLYKDSVSTANLIETQKATDPNGNIAWEDLVAGDYILVEDSAPSGFTIIQKSYDITLSIGEDGLIRVYNDGPTVTPTPPTNPPESTPTPTPSPTPTPVPTATPTPITTEVVEIADVDPAFGPETGEGDGLFMTIGILLLMAAALFMIRKKAVLKR